MQITPDNTNIYTGTGTSFSFNLAINALANYLLVLSSIHSGGAGRYINTLAAGGNAMSIITKDNNTTEIWALPSPPTGTVNIAGTWNGTPSYMSIRALSLFDVDINDPVVQSFAEYVTNTPSKTMNSVNGGLIVDSYYSDNTTNPSPGAGQTEIHKYQFPSNSEWGAGSRKNSAGATTPLSWNINDEHGWSIVSLRPRPVAGNRGYVIG